MTLQKHILAIFVVAISFFGPALALLILETVSGIKYAPMAAFWNLCIWSAGLALPVTFWFLKKNCIGKMKNSFIRFTFIL